MATAAHREGTETATDSPAHPPRFNSLGEGSADAPLPSTAGRGERELLLLLAAMQFTHVLDFVIVMPLAPDIMNRFSLAPAEFGAVVSAYTFGAAAASVAGAFLVDRFDRRDALLGVYAGFLAGTLACAAAGSFGQLLAARVLAGAFGGLVQAIVFAIVGDVFVEARRGAATGAVMSAFSFASVFGVPLGLWLAHAFSWRAPFLFVGAAGAAIFAAARRAAPAMAAHLRARTGREPWFAALRFATSDWNRARAFALTIALMFAGFTVLPYVSPYLVSNVGLPSEDLRYVYLLGGACTLFSARWIGQVADRVGKFPAFFALSLASAASILALTHLPHAPLFTVLLATTSFTAYLSGRSIPAMAMITSTVERSRRASFLTLTSAAQQLSSGVASLLGGALLGHAADGSIEGFGRAGFLAAGATLASVAIASRLRPARE